MSEDNYQRRYQEQIQKELEEADRDWVRAQKLVDHLWQQKIDAQAPFDDGMVEIGGFRERRSAVPSFHKSRHDSDWRVR